jgi:CRP/FNR family cyclic AMP-dependent transcriptional regulator
MGVKLDMFDTQSDGIAYSPGEVIFKEGDRGDVMYVVLDGEVELVIAGGQFEILGPGEPFGEMALIDNSPRAASAVTRTACRLVEIPEDKFLALIQDSPYFGLQIMQVMAHRLRKMSAFAASKDRN